MKRIESIDILRGMIMVIMALDHVRDYVGPSLFAREDLRYIYSVLFFTRWITHFCAPLFVLLAGISAFLYGQKVSYPRLSKFLITRGIWLIFIELTILHFFMMFDFKFLLLQVLWVMGWSMIILSALIYLPRWALLIFVLIMIGGHNLLDGIKSESLWWSLLHLQNCHIPLGNTYVVGLYPLIPWPGVMAAGYLLGYCFTVNQQKRKLYFQAIGWLAVGIFVILRSAAYPGRCRPPLISNFEQSLALVNQNN